MIKVASVLPATIELPAVDGRPEASSVGFLWFKLVLFPRIRQLSQALTGSSPLNFPLGVSKHMSSCFPDSAPRDFIRAFVLRASSVQTFNLSYF
jgi:hypothetical protein